MTPEATDAATEGNAGAGVPSMRRRYGHLPLAPVAAAVVLGLLLWFAGRVLLLVFAAVLLAVFLCGASDWIGRKIRLSKRWALTLVVLSITGVIWGLLSLLAPSVAAQIDELSVTLPRSLDVWAGNLEQYGWGRYLLHQADLFLASDSAFLSRVGRVFSFTFGAVIDVGLVMVIGLYLAAEAGRYQQCVLNLLPQCRRERALEVMRVGAHTLRGWLLGQMVSMAFLGVFAYLGLKLLGIPLALTLATFTALLTFIPNLGPIISVIPPVLLALARSPTLALYVILFYVVLQNLEGYFITPMVQRRVIYLPPALLITTQVFLAILIGFFGLVLAAPLTALGMVLVKMLYQEDVLGEPVVLPGYDGHPPMK